MGWILSVVVKINRTVANTSGVWSTLKQRIV